MSFNAIEEIEFNMSRKILMVNWFPKEGPGSFFISGVAIAASD